MAGTSAFVAVGGDQLEIGGGGQQLARHLISSDFSLSSTRSKSMVGG